MHPKLNQGHLEQGRGLDKTLTDVGMGHHLNRVACCRETRNTGVETHSVCRVLVATEWDETMEQRVMS